MTYLYIVNTDRHTIKRVKESQVVCLLINILLLNIFYIKKTHPLGGGFLFLTST